MRLVVWILLLALAVAHEPFRRALWGKEESHQLVNQASEVASTARDAMKSAIGAVAQHAANTKKT